MTSQDFALQFWPKFRGLWPDWTATAEETLGWSAVMRQYGLGSAMAALQTYWQDESGRKRPRPSEFVRHLRFQPEADNRSDEQREFEAFYHGLSVIAQKIVWLEMCRRRLVRNRYEDVRERERDEMLVTTLQRFCARQEKINPQRLEQAEQEADVMLARIRRSAA